MKNIILLFSFMMVSHLLLGQNGLSVQNDSLQWFNNMEAAKTYAVGHQTNILMVFAGSDWCRPCIQFKKDILEATDFQTWGQEEMVILYLDFPARRKNSLPAEQTAHNETLAEQFNKSGAFPNIFLLDDEANILANPKFNGQTVADFIAILENSLPVKD